jgi:acetyl/propionyl-CoA carboxylase alpha subunit
MRTSARKASVRGNGAPQREHLPLRESSFTLSADDPFPVNIIQHPMGAAKQLGIRHDVRAPRRGTVRNLVAESGEAVEYGQVVVEHEPAEVAGIAKRAS